MERKGATLTIRPEDHAAYKQAVRNLSGNGEVCYQLVEGKVKILSKDPFAALDLANEADRLRLAGISG